MGFFGDAFDFIKGGGPIGAGVRAIRGSGGDNNPDRDFLAAGGRAGQISDQFDVGGRGSSIFDMLQSSAFGGGTGGALSREELEQVRNNILQQSKPLSDQLASRSASGAVRRGLSPSGGIGAFNAGEAQRDFNRTQQQGFTDLLVQNALQRFSGKQADRSRLAQLLGIFSQFPGGADRNSIIAQQLEQAEKDRKSQLVGDIAGGAVQVGAGGF